ncbi:FUSC family protein [Desemzia sp. RIT804]|uniref:FUSC family protein n=1 Tax=Desemzia sp. RIT 804 TaxID=2810209 RepID=UPI00194FFB75|nr:FUSC family protein [Desemzia sp. RIT 804]MBM6615982.1 FUSC family protein [Desemzia sp. RIT 804]
MSKVKKTIKSLLVIKKTDDSLLRVFGAGMTTGIMLLIGYLSGNMQVGTFGALGAFAFLYYLPIPTKHLMKRIFRVGLFMIFGFFAGAVSTFVPWMIPITISLISLLGFIIFRILNSPKPGAFFIIMVSSMATGTSLNFTGILSATLYVAFGVIAAIIVAVIVGILHRKLIEDDEKFAVVSFKERFSCAIKDDSRLLLTSMHHAGIIFFATYIGMSLGLGNPYWVTISCAAVLQGRELVVIFQRNIQRIVGGMVGLLVGIVLFSFDLSVLSTILIIIVLNLFVEYCMVRNYGLANFFTNPLSLLLANLSSGAFVNELISSRFAGLVLGSFIAFIGAAIIAGALTLYEGKIKLPEKFIHAVKHQRRD